ADRDLDLDVADVDLIAKPNRHGPLDALTVDEGAIRGAEVVDVQLTVVVDVNASVVARDASFGEHEIVGGHTADPDLGLVLEALDPRRLALIRDPDSH